MVKKILSVCFIIFLTTGLKAQLVFNFQWGQAASFSQRASGFNDKGKVKVSPFLDNTWAIGAGYKVSPKTTLLFSIALNSHSYVVNMKDEVSGKYGTGKEGYIFKYQNSRFVYEYKISAIRTVLQKNKLKLNLSGALGVYCPRCTYYGWSGVPTLFISSTPLFTKPDSYIAVYKRNTKNYTFINTFINIGAEATYKVKNNTEIGFFTDFEIAFGKNFDHRVDFTRNGESGYINIVNRGVLLRAGVFFRPYINLKKKEKPAVIEQTPQQGFCLPCAQNR
jgi:hypothetical protein